MFSGARSGVKVTSETETLKSNEFLRRRKLRLQQVREQSKDIAKQIRQRANLEKQRHIVDLDSRKEKEYLERQERIVKQLEELYAKSVQNVGASHKSACDLNKAEEQIQPNPDLSKKRGKEATAILRQEKQKKLDLQKKALDRKLQAREVANDLFREKSKTVTSQLQAKPSTKQSEEDNKPDAGSKEPDKQSNDEANQEELNKKVDMGTQWNFDELPSEWEPTIPKLSLPDKDSKESVDQSEKSKHLDLFALSEDMPLSLRGGPDKATPSIDTAPVIPSLTLVSEYLQQRNLRLREPDIPTKRPKDLQSIKQTIARTRAVRTEGNEVCSVHDEEVVPVPMWRASGCRNSSYDSLNHSPRPLIPSMSNFQSAKMGQFCSPLQSPRNLRPSVPKIKSSIETRRYDMKCTEIRGPTPGRGQRVLKTTDRNTTARTSEIPLTKKPSVTIYNHSTRHTTDIPHKDEGLVVRDSPNQDAYAQAVKKNSEGILDKEHERKLQEMRSKIAMTKQSVEKEYNDTISFLNSLPKEKPRPVKQAFMDESRQQQIQENRQRKMQQEFKQIEKECRRKSPSAPKPRSPNAEADNSEFQYSWMPVPDSDASLAVHTIPTAKDSKQVKFTTDSYHEYRSRHKHTPPTKEKPATKSPNSSFVETLVADISNSSSDSDDAPQKKKLEDMSDAERIIIYKIVDRKKKRSKTTAVREKVQDKTQSENVSPQNVNDGIYKAVNEKGDHIPSINVTETKTNESETYKTCACGRSSNDSQKAPDGAVQWECGDAAPLKANLPPQPCQCKCLAPPPSASASTCSFRTAPAAPAAPLAPPAAPLTPLAAPDDPNNFYIGATGFLKHADYEVIIQLRKKDDKGIEIEGPKVEGLSVSVVESLAKSKESVETKEELGDQIPTAAVNKETNVADKELQVVESPKTAVSAFTQTTLTSPTQPRSVQPNMSSSASTAYMSPPDVLLPKKLQQHIKNYQTECKCNKCKHANRVTITTTSQTNDESTDTKTCSHHEKKKSKSKHRRASSPYKVKPCKCRKCTSKVNRGKHNVSISKKINQKAFFQLVNRTRSDNKKAAALDPAIKGYIHRLLALNKEGLKAVEVSNQECSSVATPGSSVVEDPRNVGEPRVQHKISLEQIKLMIKQQIAADRHTESTSNTDNNIDKNFKKRMQRVGGKNKTVHKVKSLNISKNVLRTHGNKALLAKEDKRKEKGQKEVAIERQSSNSRSKSSPTPRSRHSSGTQTSRDTSASLPPQPPQPAHTRHAQTHLRRNKYHKHPSEIDAVALQNIMRYLTAPSQHPNPKPKSDSTQMEETIDDDIHLMKIAKSKYRNMQKIADLTKKCSQRISSLAEKLEEVRKSKSKSSAYSHISSSSSDTRKSDKSVSDIRSESEYHMHKVPVNICSSSSEHSLVIPQTTAVDTKTIRDFVPLLDGIRKPESALTISPLESENSTDSNMSGDLIIKLRHKPPPALSRINLKHGQENLIPHELSTVIEVDSPISLKLKSQTTSNEKSIAADSAKSSEPKETSETPRKQTTPVAKRTTADVLKSNDKQNRSSTPSKVKMMDLQQFNDIMLKPYISVEEFAKQCKVSNIEEESQVEEPLKMAATEELSSLHSDGSLPDVVAELLKRKLIDEPFSFESPSNLHSTASEESSLSIFTASKIGRDKKKATDQFQNKENIAESSDTLSFSSNPDLENAFKQMGMGWASSTLKKTKERLALSSSSNTSSSSQNHKSKYPEKSALSGSILKLMMNASARSPRRDEASRNVEQQTSLTKSMTVKEFLTKELANKITFSSKVGQESGEFVSLYETKIPEEMKDVSIRQDRSIDESNTNRARTSTPVQLYKSATYHSSSSSNNVSNGLFSHGDELSSVKVTSGSLRHSTSDKDDLTIPNYSLQLRRDHSSVSKSE